MVLANVAAAEKLVRQEDARSCSACTRSRAPKSSTPCARWREASGFTLAKGQVLQTSHLNRLLAQAAGTEFGRADEHLHPARR